MPFTLDRNMKIGIAVVVVLVIVVVAYLLMKKPTQNCPAQQACPSCQACPAQQPCPSCQACPACQGIVINNNPTASGKFYIQSKLTGLFLAVNTTTSGTTTQMVKNKTDATSFNWDYNTFIISPSPVSATINVIAVPTDSGIILVEKGYSGTIFSVAEGVTGKPLQNTNVKSVVGSGVDTVTPVVSGEMSNGILATNSDAFTSLQPAQCYVNFVL